MPLSNFRTFQLARTFYQSVLSLKLPLHLRDQLLRSSSSVALNLAEGYGKVSKKDQRKFYVIAMGSLRESQATMMLANLTETPSYVLAHQLGGSLHMLIKKCH